MISFVFNNFFEFVSTIFVYFAKLDSRRDSTPPVFPFHPQPAGPTPETAGQGCACRESAGS